MTNGQLFASFFLMCLFGQTAYDVKRHKDDGPKQKLLYGYVTFAFAVTSACCILDSVLEGLAYSFIIALISESAPIVLGDIKGRLAKISCK